MRNSHKKHFCQANNFSHWVLISLLQTLQLLDQLLSINQPSYLITEYRVLTIRNQHLQVNYPRLTTHCDSVASLDSLILKFVIISKSNLLSVFSYFLQNEFLPSSGSLLQISKVQFTIIPFESPTLSKSKLLQQVKALTLNEQFCLAKSISRGNELRELTA